MALRHGVLALPTQAPHRLLVACPLHNPGSTTPQQQQQEEEQEQEEQTQVHPRLQKMQPSSISTLAPPARLTTTRCVCSADTELCQLPSHLPRNPQVRQTGTTAWNSSFTPLLNRTNSPSNVHYVFASYNVTALQWWRDISGLTQHLAAALAELGGAEAAHFWVPRIHVAAVSPLQFGGDLRVLVPDWQYPVTLAVDRARTWQQVTTQCCMALQCCGVTWFAGGWLLVAQIGSLYDWDESRYMIQYLKYSLQHFNFEAQRHEMLQQLGSSASMRVLCCGVQAHNNANIRRGTPGPQASTAEEVVPGSVAVVELLPGTIRTDSIMINVLSHNRGGCTHHSREVTHQVFTYRWTCPSTCQRSMPPKLAQGLQEAWCLTRC